MLFFAYMHQVINFTYENVNVSIITVYLFIQICHIRQDSDDESDCKIMEMNDANLGQNPRGSISTDNYQNNLPTHLLCISKYFINLKWRFSKIITNIFLNFKLFSGWGVMWESVCRCFDLHWTNSLPHFFLLLKSRKSKLSLTSLCDFSQR